MHRIGSRRYVGEPGETVTVNNRVSAGGQVSVFVDGVDMGPNAQFQLPSAPNGQIQWQVHLTGKEEENTVVTILTVDGAADTDFLICQVHNPLPVNTYECTVASASAMRTFNRSRSAGVRKVLGQRTAARPAAKESARRKGAGSMKAESKRVMKGVTKKSVTKKGRAKRTAKKGRRS